jgi:hypothetical protein
MSNCRNGGMKKEGCIPMSTQELPPPNALYRMITGFYVSQAIYVPHPAHLSDFEFVPTARFSGAN